MAEHIVSIKTYFLIWATLLVLTFGTWGIALIDLGRWNIAVALAIAFIKASLVALIFMHMKFSRHRTQLVLVAGLFWLVILMMLTMTDYATRQIPSSLTPPVSISTPANP